ncbi:MAG: hypothetical protein HYS44_01505 [Candidatus Niyogibacteria bacterium]|nr:hypothetical protein [Candidatus Niyogibacteria bacterium]
MVIIGILVSIWLWFSLSQSCVEQRRWFCLAEPTPLRVVHETQELVSARHYLFTIPARHVRLLMAQGLDAESIFLINGAFERYKGAYAYQNRKSPIPISDFYLLAFYASTVIGDGIDPRVTVGIHRNELIRFTTVGECAFVSDKEGNVRLVRGARSWESDKARFRFNAERAAFLDIFRNINQYLRHPKYRIQAHYPLASCGAGAVGYMQIMPTGWLEYEREVCSEICEALGVKYASPYHLIPAIFGATAILRDKAFRVKLRPPDVHLDNAGNVKLVAAAYYAGARAATKFIDEYGAHVYKRARTISRMIPEEAPQWR